MTEKKLDLDAFAKGLPTLTPRMAATLSESACFLLSKANHRSPQTLTLNKDILKKNGDSENINLYWTQEITEAHEFTYPDLQNTAEWGASAIAIMLAKEITGCEGLERTYKEGGFDYWLGEVESSNPLIIEKKYRLEVSGIINGTNSQIKSRVKVKLKQVSPSNGNGFPAHIIVVEFSRPLAAHEVIDEGK